MIVHLPWKGGDELAVIFCSSESVGAGGWSAAVSERTNEGRVKKQKGQGRTARKRATASEGSAEVLKFFVSVPKCLDHASTFYFFGGVRYFRRRIRRPASLHKELVFFVRILRRVVGLFALSRRKILGVSTVGHRTCSSVRAKQGKSGQNF